MSRHPMTGAAADVLAADGPRAELMLHLRDPDRRHADVWRGWRVLAAAPAVEGVVYAPGMSVDLGEPLVARRRRAWAGSSTPRPSADVATAAGPVTVLQVRAGDLERAGLVPGPGQRRRCSSGGSRAARDLLDLSARRRPR